MNSTITRKISTGTTRISQDMEALQRKPENASSSAFQPISLAHRLGLGIMGALVIQPATAAARALAPRAAAVPETVRATLPALIHSPSLESATIGVKGATHWLSNAAAQVSRRALADCSTFTQEQINDGAACGAAIDGYNSGLSGGQIAGIVVVSVLAVVVIGSVACCCHFTKCCAGSDDNRRNPGGSVNTNNATQMMNQQGNAMNIQNMGLAGQFIPSGPLA